MRVRILKYQFTREVDSVAFYNGLETETGPGTSRPRRTEGW